MNHSDFQTLLSSYLDNELRVADKLAVDSHLAGCAECRVRMNHLMIIKNNIRAAGDLDLPYSFANDVLRSIHHNNDVSVSWLGIEHSARKLVLGLAVLVLVMFGLTNALQTDQSLPVEHYADGIVADSGTTQVLTKHSSISNDDVLMAVLTK
jgi:anti-sigma factor RsiW